MRNWPRFNSGINTRLYRRKTSFKLRGNGFIVTKMRVCHRQPFVLTAFDRSGTGSECATPTQDQQIAFLRPVHHLFRNVLGDFLRLFSSQPHHQFMIVAVVADVSRLVRVSRVHRCGASSPRFPAVPTGETNGRRVCRAETLHPLSTVRDARRGFSPVSPRWGPATAPNRSRCIHRTARQRAS